jgi:hypothetical protein
MRSSGTAVNPLENVQITFLGEDLRAQYIQG